ncbi:kinase-like domain-containing protein [Mycena capillaripes]|nr:kinase-like domain-containing protein [Mycena capillaripes]
MPTSAKRPASRSPDGERRSKRQLTSSPPEEGEVDDDHPVPSKSSAPKPGTLSLKNKIPFPFKTKPQGSAPTLRPNVFEAASSNVYERPKDDERRNRDADLKRKAPRPSDHWETESTSSRHHSSSRNPRDRRSPSPPRRSPSPKYRLGHPQEFRYSSPMHWPDDRNRRYDGSDGYDRERSYRPRADGRADSRAWTRRDEGGRRDHHYHGGDTYIPGYRSPREHSYSYRPMSPPMVPDHHYRPISPRPSTRTASPRPPLSPPRTRAHSPPPQPPPPTSSPPPPPPPDTRLLPRENRLPPPPPSLPPRPAAPLVIRSPRTVDPPTALTGPPRPPPPELPKETVRIGRKPPAPRRSQREEEKAYGRVFKGCGNQNEYQVTTKLGEGTFGEVHKAVHTASGRQVALKRILMHNEKEGMPVTALREIKILKALNHPAIVNILDMFVVRSTATDPLSVYMVFPYMDHDLAGLLENERVKLQPSHIKLYMKQLLEGTEYMHRNHILHRDMKAANLLISNSGTLLIADFGLARAFDSGDNPNRGGRERKYTNCVVTRWYRPPELLLGARQYGGEVDMWGIGCVLGEMFMRRPILPGTSDLDQLDKIWNLCGTPNQHSWPNFDSLPGCEGVKRFNPFPRKLKSNYEHIGKETCDLLDRLLTCNPRERITAAQALDHDYFWTDPMPADPKSLPQYEASHEFDKRGHRQQQHHHHQQQQQQQQHAGPPPHMDPHRQYRPPPPGAIPPQHPPPNPNNWQPRPSYNPPPPGYGQPPPRPGPGPPPGYGGRGPPQPNWQQQQPGRRDSYEPRGMGMGGGGMGGGGGGGGGGRPAGLPPRPIAPQGRLPPMDMPGGMPPRPPPPRGMPSGAEPLNYG